MRMLRTDQEDSVIAFSRAQALLPIMRVLYPESRLKPEIVPNEVSRSNRHH